MSFKKPVCTIFLILLFGCDKFVPTPEVAPIAIIPQPQSVVENNGYFILTKETVIGVEDGDQDSVARYFTEKFFRLSGWAPEVKQNHSSARIRLISSPDLNPEAYQLKVDSKNVQLTAGSASGFFYGFQTLLQLLPPTFVSSQADHRQQWAIPSVVIEDTPAFGWRGFMLDVSRHFFEMEEIKKILDMMAGLKMNRFHWHLADDQGWRIEIKSYPKLTEIGAWRVDYTNYDETISDWWGRPPQKPGDKATYGGYYTQEDIREIVAYARERFIEIVPEIDMPGHAQATIAAYPEIGCVNAAPYVATGGVYRNNTYNPGKEETFEFVEKMLTEVMDLFPFEYIHIGGDECNKEQWRIDPHAQQRIRDEGLQDEKELQSYFIKRVEGIINQRGRKMIGWDEILEGGLAPNATVMSWRGEEGGIAAARAGHDVIMTPSQYCYLDLKQGPDDLEPNLGYSYMFMKEAYQYKVVPDSLTEQQTRHVLGTQANLWTESISDWGKLTYMTYPRVLAVAENAWTSESWQDWDDFTRRLDQYLKRLDFQGTRYATSAYNVNIKHRGIAEGIEITFDSEVNNLDYYFTLDGSDPDTTSTLYQGPFILNEGAVISAKPFRDGTPVGNISRLSFPVHAGAGATVRYITPYLDFKDAAGNDALIDYNYASLSISDDNWQGFGGNMEVILDFEEPKTVSEVQFTNLRFTISGVYIPERYQVYGSTDGKNYFRLGELDLAKASQTQGRNKVTSTLAFPAQELVSLRVLAKSPNPIPAGHHRAGQASRIYLDEIVVL